MKIIEVELQEILDLLNCAEDFGFDNPVFYTTLFDWIPLLTEKDIKEYAESFLTEEMRSHGYTEEDAQESYQNLMKLKTQFQTFKVN